MVCTIRSCGNVNKNNDEEWQQSAEHELGF